MYRILVVCTGNICRSPLGEGILRELLRAKGFGDDVDVRSAGTWASSGHAASGNGVAVAARHGVDIEDHRSTALSRSLLQGANLTLGMEPSHVEEAVVMEPESASRVHLITTFSDPANGSLSGVEDPIGGTEDDYEQTYLELDGLLRAALPRVLSAIEQHRESRDS